MILRGLYLVLVLFFTFGCSRGCSSNTKVQTASTKQQRAIPIYDYTVKNVYPHSPSAFTQGLFLSGKDMIESTGEYGSSVLRRVEFESGRELQKVSLGREYFGEGAVELNGLIYQLTWKEEVVFVYDAKSFERVGEFKYKGEGWGLTTDGEVLYMSNGSSSIYKISPTDFAILDTISVTASGRKMDMLNELEWIDGELWANVFVSDFIVRIDPTTGKVIGVIDLTGIISPEDRGSDSNNVLNGIAYDSITKRLFVTGKNWNKLFEIEISEKK